jgi:hypothetical protein
MRQTINLYSKRLEVKYRSYLAGECEDSTAIHKASVKQGALKPVEQAAKNLTTRRGASLDSRQSKKHPLSSTFIVDSEPVG